MTEYRYVPGSKPWRLKKEIIPSEKTLLLRSLQTGSERGDFEKDDAHPTNADFIFSHYTKTGKESWISIERREREKARVRVNGRAYYKKNKERCKAASRAWHSKPENKERSKQLQKRWRAENADHLAAYKEKNRDKLAESSSLRRARVRAASVELTEDEAAMVEHYYAHAKRLSDIFGCGSFQVDHTVPLNKGGLHHPSNMQVVPKAFNSGKRDHHSNRWEAPFA